MVSRSFAPFRHRYFRWRWTGSFVSNIGTWMETVALGYYVADTTGRSTWAALVSAGGFLPLALLSPVGGVLADRVSRRTLMLLTTAAQLVIALVLAIGIGQDWATPPIIALLSLATGAMNALGFPAYQASVPDLVPADEIVAASGLFAIQWNLGRILGPAAAALVIWAGGVSWALAVNAFSFLAVMAAVALVPESPRQPSPRQSMVSSIAEGFRHDWREPGMRILVQMQALSAFVAAPFIAFVPMMATSVFDGDEVTTGLLITSQGVGAVIAGAFVGSLGHRIGLRGVLLWSSCLLAPALVLYGLAPAVGWSMAALFLVGAVYLAMFITYTGITQTRAPEHLRGRLLSLNNMILGLLYPAGALLQGTLADAFGLRGVTVGAGTALAMVFAVTRLTRPGLTAPLDVAPLTTNTASVSSSPSPPAPSTA